MKKKLICLLSTILILATNVFAVGLVVDGKTLSTDVEPMIENGRTLVPVRTIFEAIGATVTWDNPTRTATAYKGNTTTALTIDSLTAYVNGTPKSLDVPARVVDGRTLVPARFVAEAMNANVWWENESKTVYVDTTNAAAPTTPTTPTTPTIPTTPPPQTTPDPAPQGDTVYVTKTGKRYHYNSNCNGGTYYASTLSEAKARGLTPCNKCAQ